MLQNLGAKFVEYNEENYDHVDNSDTSNNLYDCSWSKFKGGYLLTPNDNHPKYGEKYLLDNYNYGGWWNENECGWFFRPKGYFEYKDTF